MDEPYKLLSDTTEAGLQEQVWEYRRLGWTEQGGIAFVALPPSTGTLPSEPQFKFFQAMVRPLEKECV